MAKVIRPEDEPHWNSERADRPPDRADKAAYLYWLFAMARRDHVAAKAREKARLNWAEEREKQRLRATKGL